MGEGWQAYARGASRRDAEIAKKDKERDLFGFLAGSASLREIREGVKKTGRLQYGGVP